MQIVLILLFQFGCLLFFLFFFFFLVLFIYLLYNVVLVSSSTMLWRRQWHPTPVLLPGKSHGRRSLVGCSPWGHKELDTTERLHFDFSLSCIGEWNGNPLQCSCLENPRDGEPDGLPSLGLHRVGHNWSNLAAAAAAVQFWTVIIRADIFVFFLIFHSLTISLWSLILAVNFSDEFCEIEVVIFKIFLFCWLFFYHKKMCQLLFLPLKRFSSFSRSHSVISDSLWSHGL